MQRSPSGKTDSYPQFSAPAAPPTHHTHISIGAELDEKALPLEAQLAHLGPVESVDLRDALRRKMAATEPRDAQACESQPDGTCPWICRHHATSDLL